MTALAALLGLVHGYLNGTGMGQSELGMGMVATMSALVLGLLVASAKGAYEAQRAELTQMAANLAMLDRVLANYGPETKEARAMLRETVVQDLDQFWSNELRV